jgi:hypothetical protein
MNRSSNGGSNITDENAEVDAEEHDSQILTGRAENQRRYASANGSNVSDEVVKKYLLGWLKQAGFRTDLLEAWTPGSNASIEDYLHHDLKISFLDPDQASFQASAAGFQDWLNKIKQWFYENVVKYDNPHNFREHPFRTRESSEHCTSPSSLKVWTRRRRTVCTYKLDEFNNEVCPGTDESELSKLFSASYLNGCSGPVPLPYHNVFTPVCMAHDICYACGGGVDKAGEKTRRDWCDNEFFKKVASECRRKLNIRKVPSCVSFATLIRGAHYYFAAAHYNPISESDTVESYDGESLEGYAQTCKSQCAINAYTHGSEHIEKLDPWYPAEKSIFR